MHSIQQIIEIGAGRPQCVDKIDAASLISVHGTTRKMSQLDRYDLAEQFRWETYLRRRISITEIHHETINEELKRARNTIEIFQSST